MAGLGPAIVVDPAAGDLRRSLRAVDWAVLEEVALSAANDPTSVAHTSARAIGALLGIDPTTAATALRRLSEQRLLDRGREPGPSGRFGLSVYRIRPIAGLRILSPCGKFHAWRNPTSRARPLSPPSVSRWRRERQAKGDPSRHLRVLVSTRTSSTSGWGTGERRAVVGFVEDVANVYALFCSCGGVVVLTVTKLSDGEYLLSSVALGIDEYYAGVGEAPGVWSGRWAERLGLVGLVEADDLRAIVDGKHPSTGEDLLAGLRQRSVKAFDVTFSAPKSVSLLWALGSGPVADEVMAAQLGAVGAAMEFLEDRTALARKQTAGVRRHVPTEGLAVAGFVHRTSREGDPQVHTHCLVPNIVEREDGRCVALAAHAMLVWGKAAGSI